MYEICKNLTLDNNPLYGIAIILKKFVYFYFCYWNIFVGTGNPWNFLSEILNNDVIQLYSMHCVSSCMIVNNSWGVVS